MGQMNCVSFKRLLCAATGQIARQPAIRTSRFGLWISFGVLFLLFPCLAFGSPGSALRDYKAGKFDEARKEYEQLLEHKGDDPKLHFNAGAAAYRGEQFEQAAKEFNQALSSPDLSLQQQAYYNRGNTFYYLGENNPDPAKRTETWKQSVQDFESSLKLNPQDPDAKYNCEFVKKRLEELKQQQQQNQQNKSDQQQNKDQQQNQDKQNQQGPQDKKDQQRDSQQQQQDQSGQKQDSQNQEGQQQKQKEQQQAKQSQDQKKEQQQASASAGEPKDKSDENEGSAAAEGQMTPQQAQQLLDAQKGEEMMLPSQPKTKPADRRRPLRDW